MADDLRYPQQSAGLDSYTPEQQAQILRMIGAERGARPNQMDALRAMVNANPEMAANIAQRSGMVPDTQYSGDPNNPGQLFGFLGPGAEGNGDTPITPRKSGGSSGNSGKTPQKPAGHKTVVDQAEQLNKKKKVIDDSRAFLAQSQQQAPVGTPGEGVDWAQAALIGGGAAAAGAAGYGAYRALQGRQMPGGGGIAPDPSVAAPVMAGNDVVPVNRTSPEQAVAMSMNPRNGINNTLDAVMGDGIIDAQFTEVPPNRAAAALPPTQRRLPPPEASQGQPPVAKSQMDDTVSKSMEEDEKPKRKTRGNRNPNAKADASKAARGVKAKGATTRLKR